MGHGNGGSAMRHGAWDRGQAEVRQRPGRVQAEARQRLGRGQAEKVNI